MPFLALRVALSGEMAHQQKRDPLLSCTSLFPFCSPEQRAHIHCALVWPSEHRAYLRIRIVGGRGETLVNRLLTAWAPGMELSVANRGYQVQSISLDQAGGGLSTWEDFLGAPVGRFLRVQLETPLVLPPASEIVCASFPTASRFFLHVAQRWQDLGGPGFALGIDQFRGWLQEGGCIVMSYRLRGQPIHLSKEEAPLGFVGALTYTCRTVAPAEQHLLTSLARFANFIGVGLYPQYGLGAVHITVESEKERRPSCNGVL